MESEKAIIKELRNLAAKIDDIPNVIEAKIRATEISLGIDPDNPREAQELMSYVRHKKIVDDQILTKMRDTFAGAFFKFIVLTLCCGIACYYGFYVGASEKGMFADRKHEHHQTTDGNKE